MTNQKQHAKDGSVAIQSGRDTVVHQGLTPADVRQILDGLAAQFPAQLASARQIVDARLVDFEKRIMEKFTESGVGNSQAFADPDFQYVVRTSQHAYARTGDEQVRDALIDLIARRSTALDRTRLQLTLNEAVDKAAVLTRNEFAELSLCYLLKYTINHGISSLGKFAAYFHQHIAPLLDDISLESASYQYIDAQSCGNLGLGSIDAISIFRTNYGGIFSRGFERSQLDGHLPEGKKDVLESYRQISCTAG